MKTLIIRDIYPLKPDAIVLTPPKKPSPLIRDVYPINELISKESL